MMKIDYKVETVNYVDIVLSNELNVINVVVFVFDFILKR